MTPFEIVLALLVGITSVARTARLLVWDAFPPLVSLRVWWDERFDEDGWGGLLHCQFCLTPYMAAVMAGWWYLADGHWTWWAINGVWGFSYLAAIMVSYDTPE